MVTKRPASPGHAVKRYAIVDHGLLHDDDGPLVHFKDYAALLSERDAMQQEQESRATDVFRLNAQIEGVESFLVYCRKLARDYPTSMVAKAINIIELNADFYIESLTRQ